MTSRHWSPLLIGERYDTSITQTNIDILPTSIRELLFYNHPWFLRLLQGNFYLVKLSVSIIILDRLNVNEPYGLQSLT